MPEGGPVRETPTAGVRSLNCPNCGAVVTVRSFGNAVNVVCGSCHSILDAQNPEVKVLQQFKAAIKYEPLIPLGSRGKLRGTLCEVIGFQVRQIEVDGIAYSWREYLLFNPYKGFVYLTEYDGHWNYVTTLRSLPESSPVVVNYLGESYRHFQTATAATTFVLGEFPWQVRVGEKVEVSDYVSPPRVISSEITSDKEVNWSLGEYMTGADLWKAFSLQGQPPEAMGVYENQPSPIGEEPKKVWRYCLALLVAAVVLAIFMGSTTDRSVVFQHSYTLNAASKDSPPFVTEAFQVAGRTSALDVLTSANVGVESLYVHYVLVNEDTHQNYNFNRDVSMHDEAASGLHQDSVSLPGIAPGRYHLQISPETSQKEGTITYTVTVQRGGPSMGLFALCVGMLVLPAVALSWRKMNFEHRRWQESDSSSSSRWSSLMSGTSSGGDDDDSDDDS